MSCFSESSLHFKQARCRMKIFSWSFFDNSVYACRPFLLEKNMPLMLVMILPFSKKETSWSVSISAIADLTCFAERVTCSCVSSPGRDELVCHKVVTVNDARNSFVVSSTSRFFSTRHLYGSDISSSWSSSTVRAGPGIVVVIHWITSIEENLVASENLRMCTDVCESRTTRTGFWTNTPMQSVFICSWVSAVWAMSSTWYDLNNKRGFFSVSYIWRKDCGKTRKNPSCWSKTSVVGNLVGGVQAFAEHHVHWFPVAHVSLKVFDIIFLTMSARLSTLVDLFWCVQSSWSCQRRIELNIPVHGELSKVNLVDGCRCASCADVRQNFCHLRSTVCVRLNVRYSLLGGLCCLSESNEKRFVCAVVITATNWSWDVNHQRGTGLNQPTLRVPSWTKADRRAYGDRELWTSNSLTIHAWSWVIFVLITFEIAEHKPTESEVLALCCRVPDISPDALDDSNTRMTRMSSRMGA